MPQDQDKVIVSRRATASQFLEDIRMSQMMASEIDIDKTDMMIEITDLEIK